MWDIPQSRKFTSTALTLAVALMVGAFSVYVHLPRTPPLLGNWGLKYSDVVYGVFYPRFAHANYWYDLRALISLLTGEPTCPAPYVDYMFEYPPLIAAIWYLTTCASIKITARGSSFAAHGPAELLESIAELHFIFNSIPLIISLLAASLVILRSKSWSRSLLWLALPSTILYATYNWDLICSTLALASLLAFQKRKYFASGVLLGISISAKLMTLSIAYLLFVYLALKVLKGEAHAKSLVGFVLGLASLGVSPFIAVILVSWRGFWDFITHHATWYCENCLYLILVHDIFSPLHRVLALLSTSMLALVLAYILRRSGERLTHPQIGELSAYSIAGAVSLNYVFSPQMILIVSPLVFAFINNISTLKIYIAADIANFFIMFFFFLDMELRSFLRSVGLPVEIRFSPWTIDSPVQWFAIIRNVLLLTIVIRGLTSIASPQGHRSAQTRIHNIGFQLMGVTSPTQILPNTSSDRNSLTGYKKQGTLRVFRGAEIKECDHLEQT